MHTLRFHMIDRNSYYLLPSPGSLDVLFALHSRRYTRFISSSPHLFRASSFGFREGRTSGAGHDFAKRSVPETASRFLRPFPLNSPSLKRCNLGHERYRIALACTGNPRQPLRLLLHHSEPGENRRATGGFNRGAWLLESHIRSFEPLSAWVDFRVRYPSLSGPVRVIRTQLCSGPAQQRSGDACVGLKAGFSAVNIAAAPLSPPAVQQAT
jgi:hypothetical protein